MDKKILASLLMIGILAAVLGGATYAVFSDTETSVDNTMTAGTIDFSVDDENPWTSTEWSVDLNDMKPCVVHYGEFNITNVGTNPMNLWKKLTITKQEGGILTEPECVEGGGEYSDAGETVTCLTPEGWYDERCNLASYTLYDMNVTIGDGPEETIIDIANETRLDNIGGVWIYLGELPEGQSMIVNQSYHLTSWTDASEDTVTNWAQGDKLTFDVELHGEQITGPGPNLATGTLKLYGKDSHWSPVDGAGYPEGTLTYNREGPTFDYDFDATGLDASTEYSLIYYADPWAGDGVLHDSGALIGTMTTDSIGALNENGKNKELNMDLPTGSDLNAPAGAKIWLVPSSDYNSGSNTLNKWRQSEYLFEMNLITYDDTEV